MASKPDRPAESLIQDVRAFNRTVTRRLGALDESFLGCGISLGKARILFEVRRGVTEVRRLREAFDLDSGQMSRLLRALEQRGLLRTSVAENDARARSVSLTRAGRAKLDELDRKSDDGVRSWLTPLGATARQQMLEAMGTILRLLRASELSIEIEDPRSDDARISFERYSEELATRFEAGFDPGLAKTAPPEELEPPRGLLLLARTPAPEAAGAASNGSGVLGCVGLRIDPRGRVAEVKRLWVAADARGLGLGRRLLEAVEEHARRAGVERVRLETNRSLTEAQALYRASGYRSIPLFDDEPYAHFAFEKRLT
jgi:DNA-binding MarR family transcriptional regulator/GNAT superfamily N-acetyltransferase